MEYIAIKLTKCTLYLTAAEIAKLVRTDPELHKLAIQRGKAIKRARRFG